MSQDPFATARVTTGTEIITAEQAVAGVKERIDLLVRSEIATFTHKAAHVLTQAQGLTIAETADEAEALGLNLRGAAKLRKDIEAARLNLTRRLDGLKAQIKAPFDAVGEKIVTAELTMRAALLPYQERLQREQEAAAARAREAQRLAEEQARKEAAERQAEANRKKAESDELERQFRAKEAERLRFEQEAAAATTAKARKEAAAKAMQAGAEQDALDAKAAIAAAGAAEATAEADVAQTVAEAVAAPVDIKAQSSAIHTDSGSIGLVKRWTHEIVDRSKVPSEFWVLDETAIARAYANDAARLLIADETGAPTIAGVRIFQKNVQRV